MSYLRSFPTSSYVLLSILLGHSLLPIKKVVCNPCILLISLKGLIEDGENAEVSLKRVLATLKKASSMENVKALALLINSPGGSPVQSEHIYNALRKFANEKNVPILAFVEDIAASGGYILACAADKIYASPNSIIGSIGVISSGFGFTGAIEKLGIERRVYAQGGNKALLDPFQPIKESDLKIMDDIQRDVHGWFIDLVKERRPELKMDIGEDYFNGKIWSGKKAKEFGLIDGHGELYSTIEEQYGKDTAVITMKEDKTFISAIRSAIGIEAAAHSIVSNIYKNAIYSRIM